MPCPRGVCSGGLVSQHGLRQTTLGETATAADGTHPTGMHSCLNCLFYFHFSKTQENKNINLGTKTVRGDVSKN